MQHTHVEPLEDGHALTGAAATALPVVHGGVHAAEVRRQSEI